MAATSYKVAFVDGSEAVVERRPVHTLRAERLTTPTMGMQEQVLLMLWAAATGGKGKLSDFETWVETVEDWERVEAPVADPPQGSSSSPA